jgi:hypothetical protein
MKWQLLGTAIWTGNKIVVLKKFYSDIYFYKIIKNIKKSDEVMRSASSMPPPNRRGLEECADRHEANMNSGLL